MISNAQGITDCTFNHNNYSESQTLQLLSALSTCPSIETIEEVNLEASADFSADDSMEALADFIAGAIKLRRCMLVNHKGRQIEVKITNYNEETGEPGTVKVIDTESTI